MTLDRLQTLAPYIAAGTLALALVLFAFSVGYFRKSRTDFYWRSRRAAGQRGWRLFVWALAMTIIGGGACTITATAALVRSHRLAVEAAAANTMVAITPSIIALANTASAVVTATSTSTSTIASTIASTAASTVASATPVSTVNANAATATRTPTPQLVVVATATLTNTVAIIPVTNIPLRSPTRTPTPTSTLTPTVTLTPSETLVPALVSATLSSSVTPGPSAKLNITALDIQISPDFTAVSPGTTFASGFNRIYFFVKFSGLQTGILWRRVLLKDGKLLEDSSYLWGGGTSDTAGTAYFFFGQEGGFKAGKYEIRLYIGQTDKPATNALFTVN